MRSLLGFRKPMSMFNSYCPNPKGVILRNLRKPMSIVRMLSIGFRNPKSVTDAGAN
jgi:hypothetical protein